MPFTPAPWEVMTHYDGERLKNEESGNTVSVVLAGSFPEDTVCEVWGENHDDKANACLIAAAPDLYEALRAVMTALENGSIVCGGGAGVYEFATMLNRSKAALLKAEVR